MPTSPWALFAVVAATALVTALVAVSASSQTGVPRAQGVPRPDVSRIERRDLISHVQLSGSLGYADARPLAAARAGTLTMIPREGATVRQSEALYGVNGSPVVLLYGQVPAWRTLEIGVRGSDVRQLENDLQRLGFSPGAVDGRFDAQTGTALRRWKVAAGLPDTGTLSPREFDFLPGPRHVGAVATNLGAFVQRGTLLFQTASTERLVELRLPVDQRELVRPGLAAEISLPDGRTLEGKASSIGTVAHRAAPDQPPYVTVGFAVASETVSGLDAAPVQVALVSAVQRNTLSVPVTALLAGQNGGYSVDAILAGGRHERLPVQLGGFADGYVAISGERIRSGLAVTVAQ